MPEFFIPHAEDADEAEEVFEATAKFVENSVVKLSANLASIVSNTTMVIRTKPTKSPSEATFRKWENQQFPSTSRRQTVLMCTTFVL
ncbi:hypothetical protein D8S78_12440 [Natrialba swarupiae]|nr:hypothetical protein [Natrialba swarupiae]